MDVYPDAMRRGTPVTAQLDFTPDVDLEGTPPRKSRRGSETRQRTERMTLRLLPKEQQVAQALADQFDKSSVQALLLDALQPLMTEGALALLAADPQALRDLADERGLTPAQALILRALEASVSATAS
jgi:hypothetical protein